tara:strand:+ start:380 stop:979 length:600 start_codon:yes stop_codon:yes gene_type:complete
METFLINLKFREDRLKQFDIQAKQEGINYERVEAVNKYELNRKDYWITKKYDDRRSLKSGEVAAYLSHYKCMESCTQDFALIFEDDAKLCCNFKDKLNILMEKVPDDWDIIYLGTTKIWKRKYREKCQLIYDDNYFQQFTGDIYGTQAMFINRKAIEELKDSKFPILCPVDIKFCNSGLNVYIAKEELVGTLQMGSDSQ